MAKPDFRALSIEEVVATLRVPCPTLILVHARPDADCMGSAFALALWLREMGSEAWCVCADEITEHVAFLAEGIQESVLAVNIPSRFEGARVITVDTASPAQLGSLAELFLDRVLLMIDHHESGVPYADHLILPHAAASGEIVLSLIRASGVSVALRTYELLYAAISSDTGCFRYSNTTPDTHRSAAMLLEMGIDTAEINRQLFEAKSFDMLRAERAGFDRLHLYCDGRVGIITFPLALRESLGVKDEHLATLIDVARAVRGVEVAVSLRETAQGSPIRASFRSNIDFDVAAVAAKFGGGGHLRAAGASIGVSSVEEAEELVRLVISEALN